MPNTFRKPALVTALLGAAMGLATPALAQIDEAKADTVPACSASVTDHCISRGHGARHRDARHRHHYYHRHHHHPK